MFTFSSRNEVMWYVETQTVLLDWKRIIVPALSHQPSNYRLCCTKTGIMLITGNKQRCAPDVVGTLKGKWHHALPWMLFRPPSSTECRRCEVFRSSIFVACQYEAPGWCFPLRADVCLHATPQHQPPHPSECLAGAAAGPQSIQRAFHCRHSSTTQATVIVSSFDSHFDCASHRGTAPSKPSG